MTLQSDMVAHSYPGATQLAPPASLTARQQRERDYYAEFAARHAPDRVCFDAVESDRRRPWNSYWRQYGFLRDRYAKGARRLLDFGCGSGVPAVRCARIGYEVHGFDVCERNIAIAQRLAQQYELDDRTHFSVETAEQLSYPDGFFDVVSGFDILHHVEIGPAIREVRRVLKPGGVAIFREPIEVPAFDRLRNTRLVRWLAPNRKSFARERHITADERKLTAGDIATLRRHFPGMRAQRFALLARFAPFVPLRGTRYTTLLERIDRTLFLAAPLLRPLGGCVTLILPR